MKLEVNMIYNNVCGLNNLGNTCFFNSVLQNLAQTPYLVYLLNENIQSIDSRYTIKHNEDFDSELSDHDEAESRLNLQISCLNLNNEQNNSEKMENKKSIRVNELNVILKEIPGQLTRHLLDIIQKMNNSNTCQNPSSLFGSVCKKVPLFKGFQQQDSHELLRNLLDAVKSEELKRRQSAILEYFKVTKSNNLDEIIKKKIKRYGRLASHTLIDRLFGGHLLSSIVCNECETCIQRIEPFLDISLPIVDSPSNQNSFKDQLNNYKAKGRFKSLSKDDNDIKTLADFKDKKASKHQLKKLKKEARRAKNRDKCVKINKKKEEEDENIKQEENDENTKQEENDEKQEDDEEEQQNEENGDKVNEESKAKNHFDFIEIKSDNNFRHLAMQSISQRSDLEPCSLEFYLSKFTSKEFLSDKINCEFCSKKYSKKTYCLAMKQYLVCNLPAILTIHIKRFQQFGSRLEKSNKHVNFPLILDLAPFTSRMCMNNYGKTIYQLYGLVEHSGRLNSGHYTAYVKPGLRNLKSFHEPNNCENDENFLINNRLCHLNKMLNEYKLGKINEYSVHRKNTEEANDKWFYISDSHVSEVNVSKVLKAQAYILFYEKIQ